MAGIRKDCNVTVTVSPKYTEAFVYIEPPENGGQGITKEIITSALTANNIKFGLREEVIDSIIKDERYNQRMCVAAAEYPVDGENGEISYKFDKNVEAAPVEDEQGFVDYKDLGLIRTVYAGDLIAEIKLPTEGKSGMNVRGEVMRQIVGKKASYTIGSNTKLSEDGTRITAAVDGHLVFKNGAFTVETVVTIGGDVDASVGNIDFIGDIIVKGNICEGFKVSSNSNITVNGDVNGAVLESGGDIVIKKGCINTKITSHSSVSAQFCERCTIKCDGDISSQNYVICDIYCGGTLITKGSNGSIIGGRYTILNSIEAANIGSKNYTPTEITLGDNAILANEKAGLEAKIASIQKSMNDLTLIINFLNEKKKELHRLPEDKEKILGNSVRQKVLYNVDIKNAEKRIEEINISLEAKQMLSVGCKGYIYPGTKITINDVIFKAETEYVRSRVGLDRDGQIAVTSY
ncbi:MAG: FapA family protein [Oscillospiraceae bacterium]|nr:FapA family protein [Oscillospiraceae bacterium]